MTEKLMQMRFIASALLASFLGMAVAGSARTLGGLLFLVAIALSVAGTRDTLPPRTGAGEKGPDRFAGLGALISIAAVSLFGHKVTANSAETLDALSLIVAPTAGLATVWWAGHTFYRDRLRWVPTMIGMGWVFIIGVALLIAGWQSNRGLARFETVAAGVGCVLAFTLCASGLLGAVSRARAGQSTSA